MFAASAATLQLMIANKSVACNPGNNSVTINLAKPFKGAVQVTIEPGLEAADGATNSSSIMRVVT
jgi:hypothetical protein